MRISVKLALAFGLAVAVGLVVGLIGYVGVKTSDEALDHLYSSNFLPVSSLVDLSNAAQSHHSDALRHIIAPDDTVMNRLVADMRREEAAVAGKLEFFRASEMSDAERADFDALEQNWKRYLAVTAQAIPLSEAGRDDEATEMLNTAGAESFLALEASILKLVEVNRQQAEEAYQSANQAAQTSTRLTVGVLVLAVGILAAMGFVIRRDLLNQLGAEPSRLVETTQRIAQGDLAFPIRLDFGGETSVTASMRTMQANLKGMLNEIAAAARQLGTNAQGMLELAESSSTRARSQNDAASTIAAAVEEMTVSVSHINDSALDAQGQASEASKLADGGSAVINESLSEVQRIEVSVTETAEVIGELEEESSNISAIVNSIREIADQTNLLALNAAIEAARAGEQGRGFAVVADEVRKLAERTGQATKEISALIGNIQTKTHRAAASMANGMQRVQSGVALASRAGDSISGIRDSVMRASVQVSEISSALAEQTSASTEIARNIEVIAGMSQAGSESSQQVMLASQDMSRLADALLAEVGRFRI